MAGGDDDDIDMGLGDANSLPKAHLQKLIKQHAGATRVSADLSDLLSECCSEFVKMVATAANEISTEDKKATMTPEHVITALAKLEFDYMKAPMEEFLKDWNTKKAADVEAKAKRKKTGAEKCGMSEEEQIAKQKELFEQARLQAAGQNL